MRNKIWVDFQPMPEFTAWEEKCDETLWDAPPYVVSRCPGSTISWEAVNGFRLATRVERNEPLVRAMVTGVRQATGRRAVFGGVPGSTDGTILRMELGIPIVTCGPGNRQIPHQADEYVEVDELVDAAKIYVASALNFLR